MNAEKQRKDKKTGSDKHRKEGARRETFRRLRLHQSLVSVWVLTLMSGLTTLHRIVFRFLMKWDSSWVKHRKTNYLVSKYPAHIGQIMTKWQSNTWSMCTQSDRHRDRCKPLMLMKSVKMITHVNEVSENDHPFILMKSVKIINKTVLQNWHLQRNIHIRTTLFQDDKTQHLQRISTHEPLSSMMTRTHTNDNLKFQLLKCSWQWETSQQIVADDCDEVARKAVLARTNDTDVILRKARHPLLKSLTR